ncbi:MAG: acyltransferase [Candidatus Micrarchaeota archaeon]|nr:acyltransferase [Candidatus Micrarchaeota archaeon]
MRRLQSFPSKGGANSMARWWQVRNPLRLAYNYALVALSRHCKLISVRNWLLRRTGMKVGRGVSIAPDVSFDFFFPDKIEIGEGAVIGYQSLIVAHEFLVGEYRVGPTVIGPYALVGARAVVLAGVRIGEQAQVGSMSLVHSDIPPLCMAAGVPAKVVKKLAGRPHPGC